MQALIVTEPFGEYAKGDQITDADKMNAARADHAWQIVAVNLPDPAKPAPPAAAPAPATPS